MGWCSQKFRCLAVIAGGLVAGASGVGGCRSSKPTVQWETAAVDRGRVVARVTATGTLSALVTVQVGSQVSGRIQQLYVDFNSPVKKGQLIAKIDPQLFQASLEQARANYAAAQGNLAKAKVQAAQAEIDFKRQSSLAERKLIAPAELDLARTNFEAAKAQIAVSTGNLQQAKAALNQAKVNLAYTNIISPTDGVVISRSVDVGQTVAASLSAPTIFVIAEDLRKMQVNTSVAEADVGKLSAGMRATFMVDAYPGERFVGKIRQVRNAAQTVQNIVTYDAVIDVDNADLKLRPGMTANVNFVFADRENVLRVPNAALRFRPGSDVLDLLKLPSKPERKGGGGGPGGGGGRRAGRAGRGAESGGAGSGVGSGTGHDDGPDRKTVWVQRSGTPSPTSIKVGATDGSFTEVVEGPLKEGDQVVVDATVKNGSKSGSPLPGASGSRRGPRIF
jgi:HlyD family secretion protein